MKGLPSLTVEENLTLPLRLSGAATAVPTRRALAGPPTAALAVD
ncbi:hypothetical protein GCM10009853_028460 [Glycomyces scopariae]